MDTHAGEAATLVEDDSHRDRSHLTAVYQVFHREPWCRCNSAGTGCCGWPLMSFGDLWPEIRSNTIIFSKNITFSFRTRGFLGRLPLTRAPALSATGVCFWHQVPTICTIYYKTSTVTHRSIKKHNPWMKALQWWFFFSSSGCWCS